MFRNGKLAVGQGVGEGGWKLSSPLRLSKLTCFERKGGAGSRTRLAVAREAAALAFCMACNSDIEEWRSFHTQLFFFFNKKAAFLAQRTKKGLAYRIYSQRSWYVADTISCVHQRCDNKLLLLRGKYSPHYLTETDHLHCYCPV